MLAIRLQRTGRTGHAQFRLIVQDSRFSPSSGRVVEALGSYNPHTKTIQIDKDSAAKHLANGAQPSPRAARLLKAEGVKLPDWVAEPAKQKRAIRNPEKLRRNRPAGTSAPEPKPADSSADLTAEAPAKADALAKEEPAAEGVAVPAEAESKTEASVEKSKSAEESESPKTETEPEQTPEPKTTEHPKVEAAESKAEKSKPEAEATSS
ncbi:30S ribosomal protein S16 [Candidatus Saccharibacteria bacterium]|nr:30S ribosomal protein S16 [Candidatus Saccharibacteria bacterium]